MPQGRLMKVKLVLEDREGGGKKRVFRGEVLPLTPNYQVMPFALDDDDLKERKIAKEKIKDTVLVEFRKLANRNAASIEKVLD